MPRFRALLLASLCLPLLGSLPASAKETFTARVLTLGGPMSGVSATLIMTVEEWSTPEQRKQLYQTLAKGGQEALLKQLQAREEVGWVRLAMESSWRLRLASSYDTPEGRVVRLVTDRPIWFVEAWENTRSMDYPFGVIQFTLDENGKGEGLVIAMAKVELGKDGQIEIKTHPNVERPQRLTHVRAK